MKLLISFLKSYKISLSWFLFLRKVQELNAPKHDIFLSWILFRRLTHFPWGGTMCPLAITTWIKIMKKLTFFAVCMRISEIYLRVWKINFLIFWPLTWPPTTSSNFKTFFYDQTVNDWKCSIYCKNQQFSTKFLQKMYFCLQHTFEMPKYPHFFDLLKYFDFAPNLSKNFLSGQ